MINPPSSLPVKGVTIGADPELFLVNRKLQGVSAIREFPGTSQRKPIMTGSSIIYPDNVLMEVAFKPGEGSEGGFRALKEALRGANAAMPPHLMLEAACAKFLDRSELIDRRAWRIGCKPSMNAWNNTSFKSPGFFNEMRTGSFHIHIGWDMLEEYEAKVRMVRLLDIFVGCAAAQIEFAPMAKARRMLYGKAGEFRPTSYGLEYRVVGGHCLVNPMIPALLYDLVNHACWIMEQRHGDAILKASDGFKIQSAINNSDCKLAKECLDRGAIPLMLLFRIKHMASLFSDLDTKLFHEEWGFENPVARRTKKSDESEAKTSEKPAEETKNETQAHRLASAFD